jgi:hypothetical protein
MGVLDNLIPHCSYDGVPFFLLRQQGLPTSPRFGTISSEVDRYAPFSYPAVVVTQVTNTGLLDTISRIIAITGPNLSSLRGKVQIGYRSLIFAGDASQSGRLINITQVDSLPPLGFLFVQATWRGRP